VTQEGILNCFGVGEELTADAVMKKEMRAVHQLSKKRNEILQTATDAHTGLEILHTFILDLLGRDTHAAQIFIEKAGG
jgi:hypothetical protein